MSKFKYANQVWHEEFGAGIILHQEDASGNVYNAYFPDMNLLSLVSANSLELLSIWIPCSERLPKHGEMVLVFNGNSIEIDALAIGEFAFECWCDSVTHWMPLPAPPMEVER